MRPVDVVNLPRFDQPPPEARTSDDGRPFFKYETPESNVNPRLPDMEFHYPEHVRYTDFRSAARKPVRGFIALFRNPAQFWQSDQFFNGHVVNGSLGSAFTRPQWIPDTPHRRNLNVPGTTSYGNLVDITHSGGMI